MLMEYLYILTYYAFRKLTVGSNTKIIVILIFTIFHSPDLTIKVRRVNKLY